MLRRINSVKIYISPFVFTLSHHQNFGKKNVKNTHLKLIRPYILSGLQPNHSMLQPSENCNRKLIFFLKKISQKTTRGTLFLKTLFQNSASKGYKIKKELESTGARTYAHLEKSAMKINWE